MNESAMFVHAVLEPVPFRALSPNNATTLKEHRAVQGLSIRALDDYAARSSPQVITE